MPYILEDLEIDRVDLVNEGANSAAFIELFKRKEQTNNMDFDTLLTTLPADQAAVIKEKIALLEQNVQDAESNCTEAQKANKELEKDLQKAKASTKEETDNQESIVKGLSSEAQELFALLKTQKEIAEDQVRKSKEEAENKAAIEKAAKLKALPVPQEKLVEIVKTATPELLDILNTINIAVEGAVLSEVGKDKPGKSSSADAAWAAIEKASQEVLKEHKGITKEKAISIALDEQPDLYNNYVKGGIN